jgi:hypothetical protein
VGSATRPLPNPPAMGSGEQSSPPPDAIGNPDGHRAPLQIF